MREIHEPANALRDRHELVADEVAHRLALDELHRDERDARGLADVEDRHRVRMTERGRRATFTEQTRGRVGQIGAQHLERDAPPEDRVVDPIDLAHAARAEERLDAVPADFGSRGEHGLARRYIKTCEHERMNVTIRKATEDDFTALGRMAAALVRFHHALDDKRFLIVDNIEQGYGRWLVRESTQRQGGGPRRRARRPSGRVRVGDARRSRLDAPQRRVRRSPRHLRRRARAPIRRRAQAPRGDERAPPSARCAARRPHDRGEERRRATVLRVRWDSGVR